MYIVGVISRDDGVVNKIYDHAWKHGWPVTIEKFKDSDVQIYQYHTSVNVSYPDATLIMFGVFWEHDWSMSNTYSKVCVVNDSLFELNPPTI
jgi:hypothetical protein